MVVRVVRTVIGFLPFAGKPMNVARTQKPMELTSAPDYRAKNSRSLEPRSRRSACTLARVDEQGALSQVQKTTAMNEGARVHPALLLRIATLRGNGALKASTLPYLYGISETN